LGEVAKEIFSEAASRRGTPLPQGSMNNLVGMESNSDLTSWTSNKMPGEWQQSWGEVPMLWGDLQPPRTACSAVPCSGACAWPASSHKSAITEPLGFLQSI